MVVVVGGERWREKKGRVAAHGAGGGGGGAAWLRQVDGREEKEGREHGGRTAAALNMAAEGGAHWRREGGRCRKGGVGRGGARWDVVLGGMGCGSGGLAVVVVVWGQWVDGDNSRERRMGGLGWWVGIATEGGGVGGGSSNRNEEVEQGEEEEEAGGSKQSGKVSYVWKYYEKVPVPNKPRHFRCVCTVCRDIKKIMKSYAWSIGTGFGSMSRHLRNDHGITASGVGSQTQTQLSGFMSEQAGGARDVLVVPASTVASESAFSAGGRVLDDKRSRLAPPTVNMCVCKRDWDLAKIRRQGAKEFDPLEADEIVATDASSGN
ncbi:hypothetical protein KSS87_014414 [Heliosperma pusillum]|nr:hypothetical protein KSS87_014414 [Heliosperma pusillum]